MKKFSSLILAMVLLLSLFCFNSCNIATSNSNGTSNTEKTDSSGVSNKAQVFISSENYEVTVSSSCYVDNNDLELIRERAENGKKSDIFGNLCHPIFKMDTKADLEQFKADFGEIFDIYNTYNTANSFEENTLEYDELFFENNTLFVIYVGDTSSSIVYGVDSVCVREDFLFEIDIKQINNPGAMCDDITGYLFTVAIPTALVGDCDWFDAY